VDHHVAGLQRQRTIGLVGYRGDHLRLVIERALSHGHYEIIREQQLQGSRIVAQLGAVPQVLHRNNLRRILCGRQDRSHHP